MKLIVGGFSHVSNLKYCNIFPTVRDFFLNILIFYSHLDNLKYEKPLQNLGTILYLSCGFANFKGMCTLTYKCIYITCTSRCTWIAQSLFSQSSSHVTLSEFSGTRGSERERNFDFILFHWRLHFFQKGEWRRMHASKSTAVIIMTMTWHTFRLAQSLASPICMVYRRRFTTELHIMCNDSWWLLWWFYYHFLAFRRLVLFSLFCVANKGNMTRIFLFLPPPQPTTIIIIITTQKA